jgi:hypothetical protein
MRIILFKQDIQSEWERYVDIGTCDRDYYSLNIFLSENHESISGKIYFENYKAWYENFKIETLGSKMLILRYYISEYMGWGQSENSPQLKYFQDCYGKETFSVINNNLNFFLEFINKWFQFESPLFKGLDLCFDDIEDQFLRKEITEEGNISEIEFEDGSMISFVDGTDFYKSVFVPESEFQKLNYDIETITNKFMPNQLYLNM